MPSVGGRRVLKVTMTTELRGGFCVECGHKTEKQFYFEGETRRARVVCPVCGGQGKLIVRMATLDSPKPPSCAQPRCITRFLKESLLVALLSVYHGKRVKYATSHRDDDIPEYYRSGRPMPVSIKQAIWEILKLSLRR